MDLIGEDGIELVRDIANLFWREKVDTKIIAASIRSPKSAVNAWKVGADICTLPCSVFDQMFRHPLTDEGLKQFAIDFGINF